MYTSIASQLKCNAKGSDCYNIQYTYELCKDVQYSIAIFDAGSV